MRCLVLCNGDYGDLAWYKGRAEQYDAVVCADGGFLWAKKLGITPTLVVGDMDSLPEAERYELAEAGVIFEHYPREKDLTDTQIAFKWALKNRFCEVVVWGGTGSRLDHTLSNLFSAGRLVKNNIKVKFERPDATFYLVAEDLVFPARKGDTVSLIVLGDKAEGVTLTGFYYPLQDAPLEGHWQYAVSNLTVNEAPVIHVKKGLLLVVHYRGDVD